MNRAKILIVDDDPILVEGYSRVLRLADYEVVSEETGRACLAGASAHHPDLILLDVRLPDISGIEVCRRLKSDPQLSRIPVIMVTGMANSSDDQAEGIEAGADVYLPKPVHLRTLLAHLQMLLQVKQVEATRELASLARYPGPPSTSGAARALGIMPLKESLPVLFEELVQHYGDLLDVALERRLYKVGSGLTDSLRALGDQLGFLKGGPRDVVQVHHAALERKSVGVTLAKARAYLEEGRLVVLELMGHLLSYYRSSALSTREAGASGASMIQAKQGSRDE